jgi:poly-gamma-glutamate synthesis protein (capsule biosynthesis protein)
MRINKQRILLILIITFCFNLIISCDSKPQQDINKKQPKKDTLTVIHLSFTGDLMCHQPQFEAASTGDGHYNFLPFFSEVKKYLEKPDIMFGNFETVTAGKEEKFTGYPAFNSPDEYIKDLKNAGFKFLFTANNHCFDRNEKGVLKTIKNIEDNGLLHSGTSKSQEDRDSVKIFMVKGIKISVLAYTYGINGKSIPSNKKYLVNFIDAETIKKDISNARNAGAEIIIVYFHYGEEYQREPNSYEKNIVDKTVEYGADIVIGGHPHVLQPADFFTSSTSKIDTVFVAYSTGNFITNQKGRYKDAGVIINVEISKNLNTGKINLGKTSFIPVWIFKGTSKNQKYIIFPSEIAYGKNLPGFLSNRDISDMKQSYDDTESIMTKYSDRIKVESILVNEK